VFRVFSELSRCFKKLIKVKIFCYVKCVCVCVCAHTSVWCVCVCVCAHASVWCVCVHVWCACVCGAHVCVVCMFTHTCVCVCVCVCGVRTCVCVCVTHRHSISQNICRQWHLYIAIYFQTMAASPFKNITVKNIYNRQNLVTLTYTHLMIMSHNGIKFQ
jgi:hypothetical protein